MKTITRAALALVVLAFSASAMAQASLNAGQNQNTASTAAAGGGEVAIDSHAVNTYGGTEYAVSSAIAAPIAVAPGTCAISTSASIQLMKVGVAGAHAYVVDWCAKLQKAAALWNMKQYRASMAMLCGDDDDYRYSIAAQGGVKMMMPTGATKKVPTGTTEKVDTGMFDAKHHPILVDRAVMRDEPVMKQVAWDCPMTEKDWIQAGRPKLDPETGQPVANTGEHAQVAAAAPQVYMLAQTTRAGESPNDQTVARSTYLHQSVYGKDATAATEAASDPQAAHYEIDKSDGTDDGKLKLIN